MKLVTVSQMRALEQRSEENGVGTTTLMENAGLAVAQEVWMLLGSLDERRILVLLSKSDKLSRAEQAKTLREASSLAAEVRLFSSLTRQGVEECRDLLEGWLQQLQVRDL